MQHVSIVLAESRCFAKSAGGKEVLAVAVTTGYERAPFDHRLPEESRRGRVSLLTCQLEQPLKADYLRNLRVRVQAVEAVA